MLGILSALGALERLAAAIIFGVLGGILGAKLAVKAIDWYEEVR
jgi:hypothetical protein